MKDLIGVMVLAVMCIAFWAAIPVFAIVAGTGCAILFLKYIIEVSKEDDDSNDRPGIDP